MILINKEFPIFSSVENSIRKFVLNEEIMSIHELEKLIVYRLSELRGNILLRLLKVIDHKNLRIKLIKLMYNDPELPITERDSIIRELTSNNYITTYEENQIRWEYPRLLINGNDYQTVFFTHNDFNQKDKDLGLITNFLYELIASKRIERESIIPSYYIPPSIIIFINNSPLPLKTLNDFISQGYFYSKEKQQRKGLSLFLKGLMSEKNTISDQYGNILDIRSNYGSNPSFPLFIGINLNPNTNDLIKRIVNDHTLKSRYLINQNQSKVYDKNILSYFLKPGTLLGPISTPIYNLSNKEEMKIKKNILLLKKLNYLTELQVKKLLLNLNKSRTINSI